MVLTFRESVAIINNVAGRHGRQNKTLDLARGYSAGQLAQMAQACLDAEYQVKSGQLMDAGALEQVMLRILALREEKHG